MSASRVLNAKEKRLVADALRLLAAEARRAKSNALADARRLFSTNTTKHVDELAIRAGTCDRLAAEIAEYEVRLEKVVS